MTTFREIRSGLVPELPPLEPAAREHSERVSELIRREITAAHGHISFDRFMELALYAPGLGYYTAGSRKLGAGGDFVTAPEVSSLFGRCLARQCSQVLDQLSEACILEFGAGTGKLAADLLMELAALGRLPDNYLILELSPDLRQRQQAILAERVPELLPRVQWLDRLPQRFQGLMLGNELLDAMPVQRFRIGRGGFQEEFVTWRDGFVPEYADVATPGLTEALMRLREQRLAVAEGYASEVNLRVGPWVKAVSDSLVAGAVFLIDYGYPRSEYYHPQRSMGTLMCHYRHRAHPDPFRFVGLQDITAHVDFSAVAEAARAAGLAVQGYTTQAFFLLGCGLDRLLADSDPADSEVHLRLVQEVRRLTLPTEMGESFKVIALTRGIEGLLVGFSLRDLRDRL